MTFNETFHDEDYNELEKRIIRLEKHMPSDSMTLYELNEMYKGNATYVLIDPVPLDSRATVARAFAEFSTHYGELPLCGTFPKTHTDFGSDVVKCVGNTAFRYFKLASEKQEGWELVPKFYVAYDHDTALYLIKRFAPLREFYEADGGTI